MSSELVKRLRRDVEPKDMTPWSTLMHEAADRIEELEEAFRRHREGHEALGEFCSICHAALGGDPDE